jgi:hypothetical protein
VNVYRAVLHSSLGWQEVLNKTKEQSVEQQEVLMLFLFLMKGKRKRVEEGQLAFNLVLPLMTKAPSVGGKSTSGSFGTSLRPFVGSGSRFRKKCEVKSLSNLSREFD